MVIDGLYYTRDHEWVRIEGDTATIGITDYAQEQLGEITFVELPPADKEVDQHGILGAIESSKAASDVFAPLAGKVTEVNDALESQPELINEDCYNKGWICKLAVADAGQLKKIMDAGAYEKYLEGLE
jgi:glycine cleavage system H protein